MTHAGYNNNELRRPDYSLHDRLLKMSSSVWMFANKLFSFVLLADTRCQNALTFLQATTHNVKIRYFLIHVKSNFLLRNSMHPPERGSPLQISKPLQQFRDFGKNFIWNIGDTSNTAWKLNIVLVAGDDRRV